MDADFVLTVDLRDGPPADETGSRHHQGIAYVHPTVFMQIQRLWDELMSTGHIPLDIDAWVRETVAAEAAVLVSAIAAQLRRVLEKMADEIQTAGAGAPDARDPSANEGGSGA